MKILDLSAGRRAIWVNKKHPLATYIDVRESVDPDIVLNSTCLPPEWNSQFDLCVFDPPHMNCGKNSNMSRVYGYHKTEQILETIRGTSKEAWRVTKKKALLALKWNDHDIKLQRVYDLMPEWEPLFGHTTKDGPGSKTYWVMMLRRCV